MEKTRASDKRGRNSRRRNSCGWNGQGCEERGRNSFSNGRCDKHCRQYMSLAGTGYCLTVPKPLFVGGETGCMFGVFAVAFARNKRDLVEGRSIILRIDVNYQRGSYIL